MKLIEVLSQEISNADTRSPAIDQDVDANRFIPIRAVSHPTGDVKSVYLVNMTYVIHS